jgi:hypothetical protein
MSAPKLSAGDCKVLPLYMAATGCGEIVVESSSTPSPGRLVPKGFPAMGAVPLVTPTGPYIAADVATETQEAGMAIDNQTKFDLYDRLCREVREGLKGALLTVDDDGRLIWERGPVYTAITLSWFERSVRAAAEPLQNTTKAVAVGLKSGQLVILASAVEVP